MAQTGCGFRDGPGGASGCNLLVVYGPTLFVDVGFDQNWKVGHTVPPQPGIKNVEALVDTGATESCIDTLLATQLGLPIVDRRPTSGAHGKKDVNIYLAQIHIPTLNHNIYGAFAGVDLLAGGQIHKALIGRTFLRSFTMIYEGRTGLVTLSSNPPQEQTA